MKWYAGTEYRGENYGFGYYLTGGIDTQGRCYHLGLIFETLAYFVCKYLSEAFEIAAKTQTVGLHGGIAHFGQILADKRRLLGKIMYFHR